MMNSEGKYHSTVRLVIGSEFVQVRGARLYGMFDRVELATWLANRQGSIRVDDATWRAEGGRVVLCLLDCTMCGYVPSAILGPLSLHHDRFPNR